MPITAATMEEWKIAHVTANRKMAQETNQPSVLLYYAPIKKSSSVAFASRAASKSFTNRSNSPTMPDDAAAALADKAEGKHVKQPRKSARQVLKDLEKKQHGKQITPATMAALKAAHVAANKEMAREAGQPSVLPYFSNIGFVPIGCGPVSCNTNP
jgi:hypothetical protein